MKYRFYRPRPIMAARRENGDYEIMVWAKNSYFHDTMKQADFDRCYMEDPSMPTIDTGHGSTQNGLGSLDELTDDEALAIASYFPPWAGNGISYKKGNRVYYQSCLYRVLKDHVSQSSWTPVDAPNLFIKVVKGGAK